MKDFWFDQVVSNQRQTIGLFAIVTLTIVFKFKVTKYQNTSPYYKLTFSGEIMGKRPYRENSRSLNMKMCAPTSQVCLNYNSQILDGYVSQNGSGVDKIFFKWLIVEDELFKPRQFQSSSSPLTFCNVYFCVKLFVLKYNFYILLA